MNKKEFKKDRYREAYSRIDSSINSKHYFEAIAIIESILSDRICSFLKSTDTLGARSIERKNFSHLISFWKIAVKNPGSIWEDCIDLINQVDGWRKRRNKFIHGLVKFPNQKAKIDTAEEFIKGARDAALEGKRLSLQLSEWRKRQISVKTKHTKREKDIRHVVKSVASKEHSSTIISKLV